MPAWFDLDLIWIANNCRSTTATAGGLTVPLQQLIDPYQQKENL
jgi:hypothetical protein